MICSEVPATTNHRLSAWRTVVEHEYDKPTESEALARRVCVPLVTAVVVAIVLVVFAPPFACRPSDELGSAVPSPLRVLCWALLGAAVTAALTHSDVFKTRTLPGGMP